MGIIHYMEQRSDEWQAIRCGRITASRIADVITKTKRGEWGAAREKYMSQLIAERLTGVPQEQRTVFSMWDRIAAEPDARAAYSFYAGVPIEEVGFVEHADIPMSGCSPDGRVGTDGMFEIKVLDAQTHIRLLLGDNSIWQDYAPQMVWQLACDEEREWCDFGSYSPYMPEHLKLFVKRIYRDDQIIKAMETEVIAFQSEIDAKIAQLSTLNLAMPQAEVCA